MKFDLSHIEKSKGPRDEAIMETHRAAAAENLNIAIYTTLVSFTHTYRHLLGIEPTSLSSQDFSGNIDIICQAFKQKIPDSEDIAGVSSPFVVRVTVISKLNASRYML